VRVSFLVYGVLYVVIEIVGQQLEQVGWPEITPLDVATAVTDAFLLVAVGLAVLLATKLGAQRWGPSLRARWDALGPPEAAWDDEPIEVASWRPAPLALPPAAPPPPQGTYTGDPYSVAGYRYPQKPGRLL
jgi:hypothetical protein